MGNAGRTIAVVAAVVLALIATAAITMYIRGIEARAFDDAEMVEVFVAQEEIPAGITAGSASEAGAIDREDRPRVSVPAGAIASLEEIAGLVTADPILQGEVLVRGRWVDPADARATGIEIPEGFEAISVQVGIPPGVAGFIRAGDEVSLIATLTGAAPDEEDDEDGVDQADETRSQYLLQGIEVLAVGQRVATAEDGDDIQEGTGQVLMTVALEPADAERLVFAIENASLYFTLLPEDAEPADTPGRTFGNLFD
jgi:pilus assembly protein CpaB